jgi:hypothetical protein
MNTYEPLLTKVETILIFIIVIFLGFIALIMTVKDSHRKDKLDERSLCVNKTLSKISQCCPEVLKNIQINCP